jgi:hypothetical protein
MICAESRNGDVVLVAKMNTPHHKDERNAAGQTLHKESAFQKAFAGSPT